MAKRRRCDFGRRIRNRRRQLNLTQAEVAQKTGMSAGFIPQIEAGRRAPSDKVIGKLASVLRLDARALFLLAKPAVADLIKPRVAPPSAWDAFFGDKALHRKHLIKPEEMQFLAKVANLGEVIDSRDFIFVLIAVRSVIVNRYPGTTRPL